MFDITAIGECLIDFAPEGINARGMPMYSQNPGGAPANVLAMAARLGAKTAFAGKVGADEFGRFLTQSLVDAGVNAHAVIYDNSAKTTLAFVSLDKKGDRSFSFYRETGADIMLREDEVCADITDSTRLFHFGSVSLTDKPCRDATLGAALRAKAAGAIISMDPNYRPLLWQSKAEALLQINKGLEYADLIKVSQEEMELLTGESELEKGAKKLCGTMQRLVFVTLGENGSFAYSHNGAARLNSYSVKAVDTTGAGDAFWGAVLFKLCGLSKERLFALTGAELKEILKFANAAGALTATKSGAIPAMPTQKEICGLINNL